MESAMRKTIANSKMYFNARGKNLRDANNNRMLNYETESEQLFYN